MSWGTKYTNARMFADVLKITGKNKGRIIVAVVDSGCDYSHPLIKGRLMISNKANFFETGQMPMDKYFHGTAVCGIIADMTSGLNVSIMPIRSFGNEHLNSKGQVEVDGNTTTVTNGIYYAAANGASVINLSLNSAVIDAPVEKAVRYCISKGITVCCSASNESVNTSTYSPARMTDEGLIVVSAINSSEQLCNFSNFGSSVDICAPGENIQTTDLNGGYRMFTGTSASCPIVSGAAAMVKLLNPYYTPAEIEKYLTESVKDLGKPGKDEKFGYGALQFSENQCFLIESIEIEKYPNKMEYYVGEEFDGTGMIIKAIYNHGFTGANNKLEQLKENTKYIDYSSVKYEGQPFNAPGEYTIRFFYGDKYFDLVITVKEKPKEVFPEQTNNNPNSQHVVMYHLVSPEASIYVDDTNCSDEGVVYDYAKNTITLNNTRGGFLTMTSAGNGLKIVVNGDCKLDFLGGYANMGNLSVFITGNGTLTIDDYAPNMSGYGEVFIVGDGTDTCLKIDTNVTLYVRHGISVRSTNREKSIYVMDPLIIRGKTRTEICVESDEVNRWAIDYNREQHPELVGLTLYDTFIDPDESGFVYIGK